MRFALSKCKIHFEDWKEPVNAIKLTSERLKVVGKFRYLEGFSAIASHVEHELTLK